MPTPPNWKQPQPKRKGGITDKLAKSQPIPGHKEGDPAWVAFLHSASKNDAFSSEEKRHQHQMLSAAVIEMGGPPRRAFRT